MNGDCSFIILRLFCKVSSAGPLGSDGQYQREERILRPAAQNRGGNKIQDLHGHQPYGTYGLYKRYPSWSTQIPWFVRILYEMVWP